MNILVVVTTVSIYTAIIVIAGAYAANTYAAAYTVFTVFYGATAAAYAVITYAVFAIVTEIDAIAYVASMAVSTHFKSISIK